MENILLLFCAVPLRSPLLCTRIHLQIVNIFPPQITSNLSSLPEVVGEAAVGEVWVRSPYLCDRYGAAGMLGGKDAAPHHYTLNRADLTFAICHLLGLRAPKVAAAPVLQENAA